MSLPAYKAKARMARSRYAFQKALRTRRTPASGLNPKANVAIEQKARTLAVSMTTGASTVGATVVGLSRCPQGDDYDERNGRKIMVQSIKLRLKSSSTATSNLRQRIVIFHDKQPNGVVATPSEIFDNTAVTDLTIAPINVLYRERFTIMKDFIWPNHSSQKDIEPTFEWFLPARQGLGATTFSGTNVNESSALGNHYYIFYVNASSGQTLSGSSQFRYVDL